MSDDLLGPIVDPENIKATLSARKSRFVFKAVTASRISLVREKAKLEEKDGWTTVRRNKKSYRMSKKKPLDEQLENELWCLVAMMGFLELSDGRNFCIRDGKGGNRRQIDVFAKDNEVALIIECTCCAAPKKKRMTSLIEKLISIRSGVFRSITNHYGRDAQIKPRIVIATRNVIWSRTDLDRCEANGICVLADGEINYYSNLTKLLRTAARFQFLSHVFCGTKIKGLSMQVPATQGIMGGKRFYNFLIKPEHLLRIAYVGHRASRETDSVETYQRLLKPGRLKKIAAYINNGGKFPTNIIISIRTKTGSPMKFDSQQKFDEASIGTLTLPSEYGSAWVIDGQHRLYGYAYRGEDDGPKNDKSLLPVLAFEEMPAEEEMQMFIDINCEQVKVRRSLLVELYSDLHWNSPDPAARLLALQSRIVAKLNTDRLSPVYDRVIVTGKRKSAARCLTQTSLSEGLRVSRLLGTIRHKQFHPGPLATSEPDDLEGALGKAVQVISNILRLFADGMPAHWELGDRPGGYLCTNNAIRAIYLVTYDLCDHVSTSSGADLAIWGAEEVLEEISGFLEPVVEFFRKADASEIQAFRSKQALAGVKDQSMGMNSIINQAFPDYEPPGLREYIDSRDQEGTKQATAQINEIGAQLFNYVVRVLKARYGSDSEGWWVKGIPNRIRAKCAQKREEQDWENPIETYIYLINYLDIAIQNWDLMQDAFALGEKDVGNRKKCVQWIKDLNAIRTITHHPEKGPLDRQQVLFVRDIAQKVSQYFQETI